MHTSFTTTAEDFCYQVVKLHLIASTHVLGILPLNRVNPDSPGKNRDSDKGSSSICNTKFANICSAGCRNGQNRADLHSGTIKVPSAIQPCACLTTLGTRLTGGHHQLFSPLQLVVKVSTASEPGLQHLLLKRSNWKLSQSANLSTVWGPHILSSQANTAEFRYQLS